MLSDVPQSPLYDLGHRYEPEYKNPYLAVGLDWGYDWLWRGEGSGPEGDLRTPDRRNRKFNFLQNGMSRHKPTCRYLIRTTRVVPRDALAPWCSEAKIRVAAGHPGRFTSRPPDKTCPFGTPQWDLWALFLVWRVHNLTRTLSIYFYPQPFLPGLIWKPGMRRTRFVKSADRWMHCASPHWHYSLHPPNPICVHFRQLPLYNTRT